MSHDEKIIFLAELQMLGYRNMLQGAPYSVFVDNADFI